MLVEFIEKWGYIALFLGSLIESEPIVIAISSMAYYGKFKIIKVILITFFGTFLADQLSFFIGRYVGNKIMKKTKRLYEKSKKIFDLLERYETPFMLGFRFIYGIRIISPFFIGISKISNTKFFFLNLISAIIWSILSCLLGYYIGAFSHIIGGNASVPIIFNVMIILCIIILFHFVTKKLSKK